MTTPPVLHARRIVSWGACLLLIALAPLALHKGYWLSLLCQIGINAIFALSFNMLLGQTGLLSFGHAVYYGLGAFIAMHALRAVNAGPVHFPITLMPLVGGAAGLLAGVVFGYVTTRRAGTTFAMISLGIGEMVAASSLMFPAFFGGEAGVSSNRVVGGKGLFGITYGPQIQMYYLIAGWAFASILAMYALTQTPLGRMANAVRDNPERAEFVGYNPRRVRFLMLLLSGFFAGIAGGLTALDYEIVTAESLSAYTSGIVIMMAFVGGVGHFFGPILGAALITVLQIAVAGATEAWPFYFGLIFLLVVLYAPGGIAGILVEQMRLWRSGELRRLWPSYLLACVPAAILVVAVVFLVEMSYAFVNSSKNGSAAEVRVLGLGIDAGRALTWIAGAAALAVGVTLLRAAAKRIAAERYAAPPLPQGRT
jgi:branched-chain amino acid transport system permease protein